MYEIWETSHNLKAGPPAIFLISFLHKLCLLILELNNFQHSDSKVTLEPIQWTSSAWNVEELLKHQNYSVFTEKIMNHHDHFPVRFVVKVYFPFEK